MQVDQILNYKNRILNIAIFIIFLYVGFLLYKSQIKDVEKLKTEKETETKKNEILSNISKMERELKTYKEFINKKDVSFLMQLVGDIAKNSGINILSFRPREKGEYPVYIEYPFDLSIRTDDYDKIGRFFSNLESDPSVFVINSFSIVSGSSSDDTEPTLSLEVSLSTFLIK